MNSVTVVLLSCSVRLLFAHRVAKETWFRLFQEVGATTASRSGEHPNRTSTRVPT